MVDLTYSEPVVASVRATNHADCLSIGANLKEQDAKEIWSYDRSLPVEGVTNSFNKSEVKMTIEKDGVPIAMFGIMVLNNVPTLWMFSTDDLKFISRIFVRNTREWINKMLLEYPKLTVYVDIRNKPSKRWIEFVGGKKKDVVFMGIDDMPFVKYEFERQFDIVSRRDISNIEKVIAKTPGVMFGDCFPLKHKIIDGLYVREIFVPKGTLFVSKLFKQDHASFLLLGELSILTETGVMRVKAPFHMITKIGTKRVVYVHEDCVWITCHPNPNNLKTVEHLENEIIAKDYKELDEEETKFIDIFTTEKIQCPS